MAARQIQKRFPSLLTARQTQTFISKQSSWRSLPSSNLFLRRNEPIFRGFQTLTEASKEAVQDGAGLGDRKSKLDTAIKTNVTSSLKISSRHDLAVFFTCKVCETRSMKTVCRESYEKGVVVAECSGCNNLHLIADRLGWFGEPGSVEEFLASRGEEVKKGSVDTLNLSLEDLAGQKLRLN